MEDYIFLLIAIALSIFGAINQNRKKKSEGQPASEQEEDARSFFMDQFLNDDDDFFAEKEEVVPYVKKPPVVTKEPVVVRQEAWQSTLRQSTFKSTLPERPKSSLHTTVKSAAVEMQDDDSETEQGGGYLEDFSLRKAFVYTEIMTRKYQ